MNESVGGLVRPEDPVDLVSKIIEVLNRDEKDWDIKIAEYARNHYAQDKIIEELDELYRKAINGASV